MPPSPQYFCYNLVAAILVSWDISGFLEIWVLKSHQASEQYWRPLNLGCTELCCDIMKSCLGLYSCARPPPPSTTASWTIISFQACSTTNDVQLDMLCLPGKFRRNRSMSSPFSTPEEKMEETEVSPVLKAKQRKDGKIFLFQIRPASILVQSSITVESGMVWGPPKKRSWRHPISLWTLLPPSWLMPSFSSTLNLAGHR